MEELSDAIAYFRVSTDRQAELGHGFDYYHHLLKQHGFTEEQIYSDIDSGGNNSRKGYLMVLAQIRKGKKRVFVPDFERFTRSIEGWEDAIKDFRKAGAKLITLDTGEQRIDTPEALYFTRMRVVQAQYQREQNQYKSLKGMEFKRVRGEAFRARFPYKLIKDRANGDRLEPNLDLYKNTGKTVWEIGIELIETFLNKAHGNLSETVRIMTAKYGVRQSRKMDFADFPHDHSSLRDCLLSEEIRGNLRYFAQTRLKPRARSLDRTPAPETLYGTHPALITAEQDRMIKDFLKVTSRIRKRPDTLVNPLQGLTFCAGCGSEMVVKSSRGRATNYRYIVCRSAYPNDAHKRVKQEVGLLVRCDRRSSYGLRLETLEREVIMALCGRASAIAQIYLPDAVMEAPAGTETEETRKLRAQIQQYEQLAVIDPDVIPLLEKRRSELQRLLQVESQEILSKEELRRKLAEYGNSPSLWWDCSIEQRLILYREFVDRAVCDKGKVTVMLRV